MKKIKLGDVLDVKRGQSLAGEYYSENGRYIRLTLGNINYPGGGFKDNTSKTDIYFIGSIKPEFIMKKGDIITPLTEQVSGLLGETATIPTDDLYIQSGDVGKVIPYESKIDKRFSYYLVSSPIVKKQLDTSAQQTKIRHTSPDAIKGCIAWIPEDVSSQKKIALLADSINNKISLNNSICTDLEAMAKQLFDYWFVQFDFPDENGKPYKSSGGKMVWNEELKREIPEGWEVKSLGKVFSVTMGSSPAGNTINTKGNGIVFFQGKTDFGFRYPSERTFTTDPKRNAYKGDTLLSVRAPVGSLNMAIDKCCIGRGIAAISSDNTAYAYYTCLSLQPKFEIYNSDGTTFGCIGRDELKAIAIPCPPQQIIKEFNLIATKNDDLIYNISLENQTLTSLRDFLLPMLMNGQVKVK